MVLHAHKFPSMDKQIRDLLIEILSNLPPEDSVESAASFDVGIGRYDIEGLFARMDGVGDPVLLDGDGSRQFHRVFHPSEKNIFRADARGLLIELTSAGLLPTLLLEEIIEYARLIALEPLGRGALVDLLPSIFTDSESGMFMQRETFSEAQTLH